MAATAPAWSRPVLAFPSITAAPGLRWFPENRIRWRATSARYTRSFLLSCRKGDIHIGFGIMGGWNQAQAHAQFISNVIDFGMNVQAALELPRFTKGTFEGCDVTMESRIPESVREELTRRGHIITALGDISNAVGQGEAVVRDSKRQVNFAGSDPRCDGAAIPQSPIVF